MFALEHLDTENLLYKTFLAQDVRSSRSKININYIKKEGRKTLEYLGT